nr:MAG: hypothetical protein 3 [Leviviridae sp.]
MKSQSDNLFHIVVGICEDIRRAYPTLRGLDLDLERLSLLVSSRGLGCFTLDLPERESSLIAGLESGLLDSKGTTRYSKNYPVPRLFAGLYMRIFDRDLRLRSDADVNAIAFLRQLLVIGKKIEVPCSRKRELKAIEEYIHVEQQMVRPTLQWGSDYLNCTGVRDSVHLCDSLGPDLPLYPEYNLGRSAGVQLLLQRCQRLADFIGEELGIFCPDCVIDARTAEGRGLGLRHGPGAVAERSGRFFDKFRFSSWSDKLQGLYPWETTGKMPLDTRVKPRNHEVPARLISVPKSAKGPRLIAAEPSEHMFCQNLFASWLEDNISASNLRHFIDFRDQSKSGDLVLSASFDQELATIDLSSASDRLSLHTVERIFRSNPSILKAIHASRTRWLKLPNGECLELKKFASQGTALTFPIQTLVFWIIAMAVCLNGSPSWERINRFRNKVRVYGDDIIVPAARYAEVVELLTTLGLKVNLEKSFSRGNFRESCGVDAFRGYDVTPVKPKTTTSDSPASCQAVIDTINNLFCKGYWHASIQLEHRQPARNLKGYGLVGRGAGPTGYVSDSFGLYVNQLISGLSGGQFGSYESSHKKVCSGSKWSKRPSLPHILSERGTRILESYGFRYRWNSRLHRTEVRYAAISSHSRIRPYDCGYSGLLQRQLLPSSPFPAFGSGFEGIQERPHIRKVMRWEALEHLCSSS